MNIFFNELLSEMILDNQKIRKNRSPTKNIWHCWELNLMQLGPEERTLPLVALLLRSANLQYLVHKEHEKNQKQI